LRNKKITIFCFLLLLPFVIGADGCGDTSEANRQFNQKIQNTESLLTKQETPQIDFSLDRYLISERLKRFNDPNKMTYLYVILPDGNWLQVTIIGKLSSTTKRLTPKDGYPMLRYGSYIYGEAPDEMGVWGSSDPAKIGMTTLGSLLEIGGFLAYLYSETPLVFKNFDKPIIEINVEASQEEKAAFLSQLETLKKSVR